MDSTDVFRNLYLAVRKLLLTFSRVISLGFLWVIPEKNVIVLYLEWNICINKVHWYYINTYYDLLEKGMFCQV